MHVGKQLLSVQQLTGLQSVAQNHIPPDKKHTNRGWQTVHKLPVTASKIRKLKCKAVLSSTLMKSHIKPSRESVCAGGNESEAKPTGSSASYLVSLSCTTIITSPVTPHAISSHFSPHFFFLSSLYSLFLEPLLFLISFRSPPVHFPLIPSSLRLLSPLSLSLSVGSTSGSFQLQTQPRLAGRKRVR